MSDPHDHDDGPHEGPIKTPKQLIVAVVLSFLVPIFGIVLLVKFVGADARSGAGTASMDAEAVARRIQPIGTIVLKDASAPAVLRTGEQVYTAVCSACHASGAAGAPKLGDEAAWAPRIKTGYEALLNSALKGKNAMPAQGGGDFSDVEIGRGVVYMANKAGAKFDEPKAPAAAASAGEAAATAAAPAPAAAPAAEAPKAEAPKAEAPKAEAPKAETAKADAGGAAPALYTQICAACHAAGVAGAPKIGDKGAWSARLGAGIDGLTASAIKGKNAMPPRGGSNASDADIKAVVTYMVNSVK